LDGTPTLFVTMNEGDDEQVDILKETDFNSNDVLAIDRLQISGGTTSATSVNDIVWYVDANSNLVSNTNAVGDWVWSSNNVIKMALTDSTLEKRNVTAPVFQLYNTRTEQVGTAGSISILANTANTSTGVSMGFITADTEVETTDGSGSLKFGVNLNGTPTNLITINDSNSGDIEFFTDLDMNANALILDADGDSQIQAGTDDVMQFTTDSTVQLSLSNTSTVITQKTFFGGDVDLNANALILDADGDSKIQAGTDDVIQFTTGPTPTVQLSLGPTSTVITQKTFFGDDIDMGANDILDLDDIQFSISGQSITTDSAGMLFTVPALDTYEFSITGSGIRLTLADDVTLDCETGDDILFKEAGTTVGEYSGGANGWLFNPTGDFTIDVGDDIFLEASGDIDIDTGEDIFFRENGTQVLTYDGSVNSWILQSSVDFQINSGAFLNFITSATSATAGAQTLPSNPVGFIRVEVAGTERAIPFYAI